ncbi:heme NO-binding domain-containing protein [Paracoccus lutimaris]|uniref:Heme-NO-binding protein n=1 Tax=Paracoccus lutimaris TaxID=1490030 RepID=A0A368YX65_9RHOB|nr:heme NO-binding domain-containing protein [Paracoccus lutimaris]RCW84781.1 heme-NO-binding protein [Paracoccus lutimaris]
MHGLVNRSFELFLRDCYGDRIWERVARQSKVDPRGFFLLQSSSDSITKTLIAEASGILRKPGGELVEDLGGWLTRREPIRRLLRFSGRDFSEFVESVGEFPSRATMIIQSLKTPRIAVTMLTKQRYEVSIESDAEVWPMLLAGILRGMADDYGALAVITVLNRKLRVDVAMTEFSAMRPFELVPHTETGVAS